MCGRAAGDRRPVFDFLPGCEAMRALDRGRAWPIAVGGVAATAWLALALWEWTPYGRFLDHGGWLEDGFVGSLCRVTPSGALLPPALLYVGGWLLMTVAMMLPTVAPLAAIFARMTEGRSNRDALFALLILGYLAIWTVFGLLAHALDSALHAYVTGDPVLSLNGWAIGAVVIGIAGAFQFSRLKYLCLDQCRTPFSFVSRHWRGVAVRRQSFMLGARHGLFCLGCCWAIMLLMFAVGMGSVGWMLAIGAVMAAEKNANWGPRLSAPLGFVLLLTSTAIVAQHLWRA
jgi:predicted metal-binding membrane protein